MFQKSACPHQTIIHLFIMVWILSGCGNPSNSHESTQKSPVDVHLFIQSDSTTGSFAIYRENETQPIVTQVAKSDFRPYLHPIVAPDGKGQLTEFSPGHHKHQTGLYWGFTRVNGRDYFHHPEGDYWRRVSVDVIQEKGTQVQWKTVYHMLDENGNPILEETQNWSMQESEGRFLLDLEWSGVAKTDITIGEYDYGGLFLRMPWKKGIPGEVINAARQRNEKAEGQRAMWVDVGMQVEGRDDFGHIAIFDHPDNQGFPQTWRVDGQLGVGPVRARMGDWQIKSGEMEIIKHRIVAYTGELNDLKLTEWWKAYSGGDAMYSTASLWGIAQKEGLEAKFLNPKEAVENMTTMEGFQVNAWAAEPMITQPMAFCWDDRGRMWIAENRDYESRGRGFSNSGDSRILILEDTDGDGVADSRKVFLEGIPFPAGLAVGFGGIFLGAPPNLLFIPDKNGDDKADMEDIEVRLTGWGIRDRHETINSLHWGPDGWLYGLEGFATPSKIRKPTGKGKLYGHKEAFPKDLLEAEGTDINGGVWRYHPVKDRFEVVAHGFSNPWGIDYDAKGQLFISACVIPHLFHVVPGGIYHRQGGRHFNPYVYADIQTIVNHRHRSAHGGARVYLSDAFPAEHYGRLFMANIHEHAVLSDVLEPKGSGFVAHHGDDFLLANNAQWIGFSMELGPEGGLYVLDWHDADICGKDVLQKETGRIFRVTPENSLAENWEGRYDDLSRMTDQQLAELQLKKSSWHARRARVILHHRATEGKINAAALEKLTDIFQNHTNQDWRLRAMWALHLTDGFAAGDLENALGDQDPHIRAWAIQLLCEDGKPSPNALSTFAGMAGKDPSPVVRLYLAAALSRIEAKERWDIAEGLLAREEDREDHNIPLMTWIGVEGLVPADANRALALTSESDIPLINQFIARRLVDADQLNKLVAWIGDHSKTRKDLLTGMQSGLEGRTDISTPGNWEAVYKKLQTDKAVADLALAIAQKFGDGEAASQFLVTLKNPASPIEKRREALVGLANQKHPELAAELPALFEEPELSISAIRAIASFDNERLGKQVLDRYSHFSPEEKQEVVQTLASRSGYGWLLTKALEKEEIPRRDIPAYVARQLRRVVGNGFVEVWGPIDALSSNKEAAYNRYKTMLTDEKAGNADPVAGRSVFKTTCGACHKMYGEGGEIGPDITGANRTNLDYLLSNILDPSGDIQDDYKMVVITTRDGRTYAGNVAAENNRQLTLNVVGQNEVAISKSDIQSRETTEVSMMPQGLLETLSEQEIRDLFAYLTTTENNL